MLYTGKGDKGTSCMGDKDVPKNSVFIELLGEVDELNCLIGVVKSDFSTIKKELESIQQCLFIIQSQIFFIISGKSWDNNILTDKIIYLEQEINRIEKEKGEVNHFVIPGENQISARLHLLRAVTRRVERKVCETDLFDSNILVYFNRLSSYFYALARINSKDEKKPTYD